MILIRAHTLPGCCHSVSRTKLQAWCTMLTPVLQYSESLCLNCGLTARCPQIFSQWVDEDLQWHELCDNEDLYDKFMCKDLAATSTPASVNFASGTAYLRIMEIQATIPVLLWLWYQAQGYCIIGAIGGTKYIIPRLMDDDAAADAAGVSESLSARWSKI